MSYSLGFTAGALLYKEAKEYIAAISSFEDYLSLKENVANIYIPTNSEASRKRIKGELDKRLRLLNSEYLNLFLNAEEKDRKIILLLAICKCYVIVAEFLLEVIYPKWKRFDYDVSTYDFSYFLSEKLSSQQMDSISDQTKYKLSQVVVKMLKEISILEKDKINQVFPSEELTTILNKNGDGWFLNCLLITQ
ncbi:BrxA family protein [Cloacibacterium caeni]|uniref:BrxA family protein n=1 Tax=Cloacibacterium caeni TaxID=2004710 RepID=UPI001BCF13C9|nr:BrxA family protein [Cloacibacterium caeni]